tara:strand:+ start:191 stop:484 length:294 start_codon:yes stop_codon:yes gene_type:complete
MTDKEIVDMVESWNWNLSIFEIYDEVKEMSMHYYSGYNTGNENSHSDLTRLLNHAYEFFKYDKMIAELMSHLGVDIASQEEASSPRCIEEAEQMGLA